MPETVAGGLRGYLGAVLLVGAAILLRELLQPWLGAQVPYLQFFPAIMLAAWYGGFGPGALAAALSSLAAMELYLPPAGIAIDVGRDGVSLAFFAATGLVIAALNQRLRVSEQAHRAEAELSAARANRLDAIINTTVDGVIVISSKGSIEDFNRGAEQLFGYPAAEVIGRNVNLLMPSPYGEEHDSYLARYLASGRAKIIGRGREVTGRRKDGTIFPLHLSVGEITIAGERKFTGIVHDLSERVRMEQRIAEQAALAHLGEMAAVVAHEVKNPLAGIRGAIQVITNRMRAHPAESQILAEIIARIDSLDRMMKELLMFARQPQPTLIPTDLKELVVATAGFISEDPSLQRIDVHIVGSAPPVPADAEMLKIVFQNLLINGAHAMDGEGRIRVAIDASETMCEIEFRDSGPGIPPDIREKIFTPFFTTKFRGSGLGLPTAKRIVEAHKGEISVASPAGGGASVVVRLPVQAA